jgi:hypothetical protein
LRKAQVDLVRKLYSTVASGSSICHQVSNKCSNKKLSFMDIPTK